jgi:hypothetical protein
LKRVLVVMAVAAVSLAIAAPASLGRNTTTSPGYNFRIDVYITDQGVTLTRSVARRGWLAHFVVHNHGKKPHVFDVGGLKTRAIAPGKQGKVGAFLDVRGQFAYKVDNKTRGYLTVT